MTKEQFDEINTRLDEWRKERQLTKESQIRGFLGNVYEEISEYFRANGKYKRIDALMDITIFILNAFDIDYDEEIANMKILKRNVIDSIIEEINQNDLVYMDYDYKIIRMIEELSLNYYRCDFYHCMIEAINEISSRTGYFDNKINKFIKNKGAYTSREASKYFFISYLYKEDKDYWYFQTFTGTKKIKKWHKADYSKYYIE